MKRASKLEAGGLLRDSLCTDSSLSIQFKHMLKACHFRDNPDGVWTILPAEVSATGAGPSSSDLKK
jgi:hypothetical protein